jgi:RNA polymerase sigma-70 factor (ECF subfamily)
MSLTNRDGDDCTRDDQLIRGIKSGDETALGVLMKKYSTRVYAAAFRVLRQQPDAQEVTQDVFWALWRSPERFDMARGQLLTWLVILSRSRALDLLRRIQASASRHSELAIEAQNTSPALMRTLAPDPGMLVEELLRRLPSEQGCVLQMVYIEGYALREVASLLDTPLGTIKGRTRLALRKLRSELGSNRSRRRLQ